MTNSLILKKYKIRQNINKLQNQIANFRREANLIELVMIYKALLMEDPEKADKFKKKHLNQQRSGLFNTKMTEEELKVLVPEYI